MKLYLEISTDGFDADDAEIAAAKTQAQRIADLLGVVIQLNVVGTGSSYYIGPKESAA